MSASVAGALQPIEEFVRDAAASRTSLRIAGRSHWIDAGRPVKATRIASLATHAGIVDYVPGDLTITVKSGTTLAEIERVTAAEGQWFPSDPCGVPDGTIGATIATGSSGPLAHAFGRTRDLVLGVGFITGEGNIVRGGGRVVKNVAGFDLVRLVAGSWGTLGVITEATLRLYSMQGRQVTMVMSMPEQAPALAERIKAVLEAPITPFSVEMVSAAMAAQLGLPARDAMLLRLGGNTAGVEAQQTTLASLGGLTECPPAVWEKLRTAEDKVRSASSVASARARSPRSIPGAIDESAASPAVLRISSLPVRVAQVWASAAAAMRDLDGALMHATPRLGIVRCIIPGAATREVVASIASGMPGLTMVFERLPTGLWQELSPSVASDRLSAGIRRAFDPHGILNPGILGPLE